MSDKLMKLQLTGHETRILWFFIRHLQGYQMVERVITTDDIAFQTGLRSQRVCEALKTLLQKKIIKRRAGWQAGQYVYQWNEKFSKTRATKTVHTDPKVARLDDFRNKHVTKKRNGDYGKSEQVLQNSVIDVTENRNAMAPTPAPMAAKRAPKDSIKEKRKLLKKKSDSNESIETGSEQEFVMPPENIKKMFPQLFGQS